MTARLRALTTGAEVVSVVVSAVELVVVDLLVNRWPAVRVPLLVLGIWGLVWLLGLLSGMLTRPHAVGPDGIRARYGTEIDAPLTWDDIATGGLRRQDRTNIEIVLDRPVAARLPAGTEVVHRVTLYADDPRAFLDEVRRWAGGPPSP